MDKVRESKEKRSIYEKSEKSRESILTLINTIQINTLKNFLMLSNHTTIIENSTTIINEKIFDLIEKIIIIHKENEELMINIGELIFYLLSINNKIEDKMYNSFVNHKGNDLLIVILNLIPQKQIETYKIYLKIINMIVEYKKNKHTYISEFWLITLKLMIKFENNPDIMICNLDAVKKFSSLDQFKELINQEFIDLIIKITSNTEYNKVATLGLQILDIIIKLGGNIELMRNTKPLTFIVKLLTKYRNDDILSFHCCAYLSQIIQEEDISSFLTILKIQNTDDIELETVSMIGEIKEIFSHNKDEETLKSLKKNIMRILVLMSKDKGFIKLMKNINSLENFIILLKSDLKLCEDVQNKNITLSTEISIIINLLPEFIKLVLTILKNYDLSQFYLPVITVSPFQIDDKRNLSISSEKSNDGIILDIYICLLKSLYLFNNNIEIVQEILEFLNSKEITKKYFSDYESVLNMKEFQTSLSLIYKNFHTSRWVYIYLNKFSTYIVDNDNECLTKMVAEIDRIIESYKLLQDPIKKKSIIDISFNISLKIMTNLQFDDNFFHEFIKISNNFSQIICTDHDADLFIAYLNILFSATENKFLGIIKEKSKLIFNMLKKINLNSSSNMNIFSYVIFRILRISTERDSKILNKESNLNLVLLTDESILHLILNLLTEIKIKIKNKENKNIWEDSLKDALYLINVILNIGDTIQIAKFLRDNGLISIIQICSSGIYDFDINKVIIQILQSFSVKHFKSTVQNFKNYIIFKNFISQINDIKFSKGINEKIYYEILSFLKQIIKVCEYTEAIEETILVEHLINEFAEIYFFYLDTNNRILEILGEILSIISKEKSLLKSLINSKLPMTLDTIFKNFNENSVEDLKNKIVESLLNIYMNFMKSKEYSTIVYSNFRISFEQLKNIISYKIQESLQIKILNFFQILIDYENNEVSKDQNLTPIFFKQLLLQIPSTQTTLRDLIDKCLLQIENKHVNKERSSISISNMNLIKELSDLSKSSIGSVNSTLTNHKTSSEITKEKKKSLICIEKNPEIKNKFENIITSISNLVEIIEDQYTFYNKDLECEQLCDLIKMLLIFSEEKDNLKKIFDSGIIEKIIKIIENDNNILIFTQDQCFTLIGKFVDSYEYHNYFFENVRICQYFLKLLNNICQKFNKDCPEYIKNKYLVTCKVISCLSKDKIFLLNNNDLNIQSILDIISKIDYDKDIMVNILVILNNILSFQLNTIEGEIDYHKQNIYEGTKLAKVFQNLWTNFQSEIRIIEIIFILIETLYLDEIFIKEIIELDFVEFTNQLLKNKTLDSQCSTYLFELYDKLMVHPFFSLKLYDQKTMSILLNTFELNILNTNLINNSSTIILKCCKKDKKFISIMGLFGINEYCVKLITKFMDSDHISILKQNLEIIFYLVSDENNLLFFNKQQNIELLLKCFLHNIKTKDIVLLNLKLISIITTKENSSSNNLVPEYDMSLIIEIINEVLSNYDESLDIIMQLCELIQNIFKSSSEIWIKKILIDVIFNNSDKYLSKQVKSILKKEFIELFLNTLYNMIKSDKNIIELTCSSILFYISKNVKVNLNIDMLFKILKIFKSITNTTSLDVASHLKDIIKILKLFEMQKSLHNDEIVIFFSEILCNLCLNTSFYKEISNEFIGFTLEYASMDSTNLITHSKLLENIKNICVFIHIANDSIGTKVAVTLMKIFNKNLVDNSNNRKNLINLFQIISALCLQSDYVKDALLELKFRKQLKEIIKSKSIDDNLLEYQIKGCLLNLKKNYSKKMTNVSSITSMSNTIVTSEIKEDVGDFLKSERKVKFYTEKGEVKDRYIFWNNLLDTIYSGKKSNSNFEITDSMLIKDMESCVRSATTQAFKSKGIFSKKPKANKCFSILGIKTFNGQKTFNVECEKEDECIKYVDYITILIQNSKVASLEKD